MRLERENPLTFLEFNYMILQAYDFLELNRRFKCTLQLGGSDQWGNMVRSCVSLFSVPRSLCSRPTLCVQCSLVLCRLLLHVLGESRPTSRR